MRKNIRLPILSISLIFLLTGHCIHAQVFPVYFADVIEEEGKEILHFEWRPDYQSYDRAIISDQKRAVVAELSYPLNSLDVILLRHRSVPAFPEFPLERLA